jgi:hypothetical protein
MVSVPFGLTSDRGPEKVGKRALLCATLRPKETHYAHFEFFDP